MRVWVEYSSDYVGDDAEVFGSAAIGDVGSIDLSALDEYEVDRLFHKLVDYGDLMPATTREILVGEIKRRVRYNEEA